MFHAYTCLLHLQATQVRCGAHTDLRRGGEWGRWGVEGRPLPKPSQSRPGAALYPTCASVARGWAGSRSSWPDSGGRRPSQAEKPWLEVRGSGGARSGVLLAGKRAGCSVPRRHRQPQTYTLPPAGATLSPSAALAGNQHVGRRGQTSAEQPARDARLTRWRQRKRHGGGAKHYGAGAGTAPGTR